MACDSEVRVEVNFQQQVRVFRWKAHSLGQTMKTCIWLPWHFFTAPLRGWRCPARAYVNRLTPLATTASAISKKLKLHLAQGVLNKGTLIATHPDSAPSQRHDSRAASPLAKLSKITMINLVLSHPFCSPVLTCLHDSLRYVRQSGARSSSIPKSSTNAPASVY